MTTQRVLHWNWNACALQGISAAEPLEDSGRQTASLGDQSVLFGIGDIKLWV